MPRNGGTGGGGLNSLLIFLVSNHALSAQLWETLFPKGPILSKGTRDVIAAQIVKTVAESMTKTEVKNSLHVIGKSLFKQGSAAMDYETDEWHCGNEIIPIPHFHFGDDVTLNPQPLPPKYYKTVITVLAEVVSNEKDAAKLIEISKKM